MKNRLALFLFILGLNCFCFSNAKAQNNSAAQKLFEKAVSALDNHEYSDAANLLNESIEKDSNYIDSYITLFQVYIDLKKNEKAITVFEKAFHLDSAISKPYFVKYANAYAGIGNYKKADELLTKIKNGLPVYLTQSFNQLKTICDFALFIS